MANETLILILAALTAFFTLITGALAVAVTVGILYFKKLASDRQREIRKLIDLQNELVNKIREAEKALQDLGVGKGDIIRISNELDALKGEYLKISSHFYSIPSVATTPFFNDDYPRPVKGSTPSVSDLQSQIAALLSQIQELQKQLISSSDIII